MEAREFDGIHVMIGMPDVLPVLCLINATTGRAQMLTGPEPLRWLRDRLNEMDLGDSPRGGGTS